MPTDVESDGPVPFGGATLARLVGTVALGLAAWGAMMLYLRTQNTWVGAIGAVLVWPAGWLAAGLARQVLGGPPPGLWAGRTLNLWASRLLGASIVAIAFGGMSVLLGRAAGRPFGVIIAAVFAGLLIPMLASFSLADRRGRREVIAAGWRLCLRCRYPLVEDVEDGLLRCPECGAAGTASAIEKSWRWTYRNSAMLIAPCDTPDGVVRGRMTMLESVVWWVNIPMGIIVGMLGMIAGIVMVDDLLSPAAYIVIPGLAALGILPPVAGNAWIKRRYRALAAADHLVCPFCRGGLDGASGPRCEKCGVTWDRETLRRSWQRTYRHADEIPVG